MIKVMSDGDFRNEVEKNIKKMCNIKTQSYFAWLCAVRALPFLSTRRNFNYMEESKIESHLQAVFDALDFTVAVTHSVAAASSAYATHATTHASSAAVSHHAAYAATRAATHAAAAAANSTYTYATAADTTAAANSIYTYAIAAATYATAAVAAAYHTTNIESLLAQFQQLILNDIEAIGTNNKTALYNDISIYGRTWNNFQDDLIEIGCGYWARLYSDLFSNHFACSADFLVALKHRINVPAEVRGRGAVAVGSYMENAEKQGLIYTKRETRLIILGSAGAGKTTLVKRFNGDTAYPAPKDSTHGVDTSVKLDCNGIKTHIWDFGGQVIYHASHRCFMSENCVYILVVNARTEDNHDLDRINYWLDTIRVYSNNKAKVFIIINESDDREQNIENCDSLMDGEYKSLIQNIYSFNIGENMDRVNDFKQILTAYIEKVGHQTFGKNDNRAMKEIKSLFDQNKKIIEVDELEALLVKNEIRTRNDQNRAKELFNTLGVALSYDFMESCVLDPYWISHGVYRVIDYLQRNKSMFITYDELNSVFTDEYDNYPKSKRGYILDLMAHHKIGFRNDGGVRGLIVPCAASLFKPRSIIVDVEPDSLTIQIEREDRGEFPADFFYKYICVNKDDIKKSGERWAMWQKGMVLAGERASALVELNRNSWIAITVWGKGKKEYGRRLELRINDLLHEYHFTSYEEDRKKSGRLVKFITLVLESVAKGTAKAIIESTASNTIKPH